MLFFMITPSLLAFIFWFVFINEWLILFGYTLFLFPIIVYITLIRRMIILGRETVRTQFDKIIQELNLIQLQEKNIEEKVSYFNININQDSNIPWININLISIISDEITEIREEIINLQEKYKKVESNLLKNSWVFWNEDSLKLYRNIYKKKNKEYILNINIQLRYLIEIWLTIHKKELMELSDSIQIEVKNTKDKLWKLTLEQQILRLEQYINSIQSFSNN